MNPIMLAFAIGAITGVVMGLLATLRSKDPITGVIAGVATGVILFFGGWCLFYFVQPVMSINGLFLPILIYLVFLTVIGVCVDFDQSGPSFISVTPGIALVLLFLFGMIYPQLGVTSDSAAKGVDHLVHAVNEDPSKIPDTDANHMVIVSQEVASYKANQALATGPAAQQALNTYDSLGDATLQSVDNHMWYVFQLEFDGSGNKHRQNNVVPGYVMVDAENPDAEPVLRIGKDSSTGVDYTMNVSLNGGQSEDLMRRIYQSGYAGYDLEDPTLEIANNGKPYFTVALESPQLNWDYNVPVGLLVVDANTGEIVHYDTNQVPDWVDRVYSKDTVTNMMNWWGLYDKAGNYGPGSSNANRFKVAGDPQLVYTKGGHPSWRMLMTSFNSDSSVNYVVLFDARANEARIYTPSNPIGTEDAVLHTFNSTASGGVKSNGLQATDLTLHKLYGQLTWVVSYISTGDNGKASFQGVGLLNAYDNNAANVSYANTKAGALVQYQTRIANGSGSTNAVENAQTTNTTGTVTNRTEVVEGGQTFVYLVLGDDPKHVYRGQADANAPELIFSKVGDRVTITYINLGGDTPVRNIKSFDDSLLQLNPA